MHTHAHVHMHASHATSLRTVAGTRATQNALLEDDSTANEMAGGPSLFTLTCTLHAYAAHMHMHMSDMHAHAEDCKWV